MLLKLADSARIGWLLARGGPRGGATSQGVSVMDDAESQPWRVTLTPGLFLVLILCTEAIKADAR